MFSELTEKLNVALRNLRGIGKISEANISDALRELRLVLLGSDVNYKVVKQVISNVKEKALGREVLRSITPGQLVVKIFHDELVNILGGTPVNFQLPTGKKNVVMICGLQGSGKTTFCAKLALYLRKQGRHPLLVGLDPYRPAAVDQLKILGKSAAIPVYDKIDNDVVSTAKNSLLGEDALNSDTVILDTAGRLHVDDVLMDELVQLKGAVNPVVTLYIADGMTGQDAVKSASAFLESLEFDGTVLTKLDGDAKGGAALSISYITSKPIYFISTGEKLDALELFYPDRMVSRIMGKGDIVSLVEKAQETYDDQQALKLQERMLREQFTLQDFLDQLQQIKKLGPLQNLMEMLPVGGKLKGVQIDDHVLFRVEAIMNSMTHQERNEPRIINGSRKKRIAKGSGTSVEDVNKLLKQFEQMKKMMKQMSRLGKKQMNQLIMQ